MSDLVKRLRNDAVFDRLSGSRTEIGLSEAAADRIEQLERVLLQAREALCSVDGVGGVIRWNGKWEGCENAISSIDEALK